MQPSMPVPGTVSSSTLSEATTAECRSPQKNSALNTLRITICQINKGEARISSLSKDLIITALEFTLGPRSVLHLQNNAVELMLTSSTDKMKNKLASIEEENKLLQLAHQITVEASLYKGEWRSVIRRIKTLLTMTK